jgi:hypothetical protein
MRLLAQSTRVSWPVLIATLARAGLSLCCEHAAPLAIGNLEFTMKCNKPFNTCTSLGDVSIVGSSNLKRPLAGKANAPKPAKEMRVHVNADEDTVLIGTAQVCSNFGEPYGEVSSQS